MRIIPTRKYSSGIPSKKRAIGPLSRFGFSFPRDERGQGFLEYLLVLLVVLGMIFVLARPVIASIQKKFEKGLKSGIFLEDPSGNNFYYFPLKTK